jgi:hypothetical protein
MYRYTTAVRAGRYVTRGRRKTDSRVKPRRLCRGAIHHVRTPVTWCSAWMCVCIRNRIYYAKIRRDSLFFVLLIRLRVRAKGGVFLFIFFFFHFSVGDFLLPPYLSPPRSCKCPPGTSEWSDEQKMQLRCTTRCTKGTWDVSFLQREQYV